MRHGNHQHVLITFRAAAPRRRCTGLWFCRDAGLPNGQVPILEADGKVLPQSGAQLRYAGKLAGTHTRSVCKKLYGIILRCRFRRLDRRLEVQAIRTFDSGPILWIVPFVEVQGWTRSALEFRIRNLGDRHSVIVMYVQLSIGGYSLPADERPKSKNTHLSPFSPRSSFTQDSTLRTLSRLRSPTRLWMLSATTT